jgi:Arm domain-containing DNA-binding protein
MRRGFDQFRWAAKLLSKDEARRIASNIAKLPVLLRLQSDSQKGRPIQDEVMEAEARPTDTDGEVAEEMRPDLVWDNEAPGLCVRVHGDGEKSFIFVYRRDNRQRFVRIGITPRWSREGARRWAKELRSAVDRGDDPEHYNRERQEIANRERQKIKPVESFIRLIAEAERSEP